MDRYLKYLFAGKEVKSVPLQTKNQEKENLKLNDVSYRSWRLGSLYENDNNGIIFCILYNFRNSEILIGFMYLRLHENLSYFLITNYNILLVCKNYSTSIVNFFISIVK